MLTLIDRYLAYKQAGDAAPSTLYQRRCILSRFATHSPLEHATPETITHYLTTRTPGAAGRRSTLAALRGFYTWANLAGHLDHNPTQLLHPIKERTTIPRPTPTDAIRAGLLLADRDTAAAILLGWRAGLRLSEIASLHADHVTTEGLRITGKGRRQRLVPVHPDLRPHLAFHDWCFPSPVNPDRHVHVDYIADRIVRATGQTAHGLRHRFATDVYAAHKDLRGLQLLLGHSSLATTQRYVHVDSDRLAALVTALP